MTLGAERKLNKKVNLGGRILDYEVQLKGKKIYKLRFKISVQYQDLEIRKLLNSPQNTEQLISAENATNQSEYEANADQTRGIV